MKERHFPVENREAKYLILWTRLWNKAWIFTNPVGNWHKQMDFISWTLSSTCKGFLILLIERLEHTVKSVHQIRKVNYGWRNIVVSSSQFAGINRSRLLELQLGHVRVLTALVLRWSCSASSKISVWTTTYPQLTTTYLRCGWKDLWRFLNLNVWLSL